MPEMVVTLPDGAVTRYRLGPVAVIGRHPECEIVLTDPMSSRKHCRVEQLGGNFFVEDHGSANGTILNGEALKGRKPFHLGDTLQIGFTRLVLKDDAPVTVTGVPGVKPFDPTMSMVSLKEDVAETAPNFDFTMAAGGFPVTADEEATSDLTQLKRVTQRLKLLLDMGQSLGSTLRPRKVMQTCLDKLFEVFPHVERGFILLVGPDGSLPSSIAPEKGNDDALEERKGPLSVSRVRSAGAGEENQVKVSRTVVNRVLKQRQSVLVSDVGSDAEYSPALSMASLEIRSVMCAPLISDKEDLGLLYLDSKDSAHRFGPDDLNLLNAIAGQLAVVIKNAELARDAAAEAASRENLQRFLSPHLVDRILKKEMTFELGGTNKHGTVFFSDIVGFTRMAAKMRPSDVVALLNRYFRVMQEIIFSRGGTVDKFGGDQIMAFWGVLVDTPHATAAAATAAIEMQNAMLVFNRELEAAVDIVKPPEPLGHGIGLNTGEFVAGNIGSERKIEFTVIGNAVNLAQRLEATAGRGQVFIGQGTYDEIRERALVFRMPDCGVKNVDQPIPVYSLRGIIPPVAPGAVKPASASQLTSRMEPGADEMLFSLPCSLVAAGQPVISAHVCRMSLSRTERRGRFQVISDRPLPAPGTPLRLLWTVQEKASLPAFEVVVENPPGSAGSSTQTAPGVPAGAPPEGATASSISRYDAAALKASQILVAKSLPDELLAFRPGAEILSDLESADQIVRA